MVLSVLSELCFIWDAVLVLVWLLIQVVGKSGRVAKGKAV